ncbi:MAG: PEP/pyruvate-binding domain-containing protein [bacterium]
MAPVSSGIEAFDDIVQGLRLGDNVVWQVDRFEDYSFFTEPFVSESLRLGRHVVYFRFATHAPVLSDLTGVEVIELDPQSGFDNFSRQVHNLIEERGEEVFYVFDNLSSLVEYWATDVQLANFFQVTCPYLFELKTIAFFALTRGFHAHTAVARIRDTTQLLIEVYHVDDRMYVHPLKVWDRYSQQMFLPHQVLADHWTPLSTSGDAAGISRMAKKFPLRRTIPSIAPWESIYHKLIQYCGVDEKCREVTPELKALQRELSRMILGHHPEFERLAEQYFTPDNLIEIRERLIGSGRIGGKAAGMLLARSILGKIGELDGVNFREVSEEHDSFYIGSDVFYTFLVTNNLFRLRLELSSNAHMTHEEFSDVEKRFLAGTFPTQIVEQFRSMLDYYGQAPIIVRSSSLLEDGFGSAFAGKYRSEFCANQGDPEERLQELLNAIKLVYASSLNPNVLSYRHKRGLGESDEQMAILVQRVAGMPQGPFFFPILAGVAFSRNLYAWSERIDPSRGVIRLVYGLGTRAVDRVDVDYPRMIAVSNPGLRPEIGYRIKRYSQRQADVLDLMHNTLTTLPYTEVIQNTNRQYLHYLVSILSEGGISDPISHYLTAEPDQMLITFNNLIRKTDFVKIIDKMLVTLEGAYGHPVDTEFTASVSAQGGIRINLLQCRPLFFPGPSESRMLTEELPQDRVLFRTNAMMNGGEVRHIRYIVYVDPETYSHASQGMKQSIGRLIGQLNELPELIEGKVIMMGPGRWGSSNIDLGVNVGYADLSNAAVLIEIAREEAGHMPEVSYGTHFFLDLVESQIIFLAVYPDEPSTSYDDDFFLHSPNMLNELVPNAEAFTQIVRVIDVPSVAAGQHACVIAASATRNAMCFLE